MAETSFCAKADDKVSEISKSMQQRTVIKAVWLYEFPRLDNQTLVDELREMKINRVYVSIDASRLLPDGSSASLDYSQKVQDFVDRAHKVKIGVHAMTLEDPTFTYVTQHTKALQLVDWILKFCANAKNNPAFEGIHVDIEPHAMPAWAEALRNNKWATLEGMMQQYVQLLIAIKRLIHNSNVALEFSAATHWQYTEWAKQGKLNSADAKLISKSLDMIVPMIYEIRDGEKIYLRAANEVRSAPTLVGVSAENFIEYLQLEKTLIDGKRSPPTL